MRILEGESFLSQHETRLRDLLLQGQAGDADAYRCFLAELGAFLRAFVRRRLAGLPDDIEDVVQEILIAVHNQRHTFEPGEPLTPWVHAIARYKLADLHRRRATREALTDTLDEESEVLASRDDQAGEARRDLDKLLAQLPDRQRLPIIHVKLEGLSVAETAQRCGMSESAVKVGVHRGLKYLARLIGEQA